MKLVNNYYKQGFRQFHCSNTIPVKEGGLSGTAIIPYTSMLKLLVGVEFMTGTN